MNELRQIEINKETGLRLNVWYWSLKDSIGLPVIKSYAQETSTRAVADVKNVFLGSNEQFRWYIFDQLPNGNFTQIQFTGTVHEADELFKKARR